MSMVYEKVFSGNIHLVELFLERLGTGKNTFRYFQKRPINTVLNHLVCVVLHENNVPIAYGHLEKESNFLWLGVAVAEIEQGKGFGKQMVNYLIQQARNLNEPIINLTVDKTNEKAITLYESLGFTQLQERDNFFKYQLVLIR